MKNLCDWVKRSFVFIKLKKQGLFLYLDTLDQVKEVRHLTEDEAKQDFELCLTLENLLK